MKNKQNRREFLKAAPAKVLGLGAASELLFGMPAAYGANEKVKVALVHNERAISSRNECDQKQAALMVERGLLAVTDKMNAKEAWVSLGISKEDVVGIKVNCNAAGFLLYGHPELVYALCESLQSVVPPNNIIIYERYTGELSRCGYKTNMSSSGVRCFGTDEGGGFHPEEELTRIATDTCTKIINFPSLKYFGGSFVGTLFLKNHIGSLPPSHMSRGHGGNEIFSTQVCARPSIRNKTILGVCDGLRATYQRDTPWYYCGIIMSRDQIAAEYAALTIISEKRKQEKLAELEIPSYVKQAESKYHLGTCNPEKIDIMKLEV